MSPLRAVWNDYLEAGRAFSRPARRYLTAELLAWTGNGVFQVLFNLYLVQGGFKLTLLREEEVNLETAFMRLTKGMVQ